MDPYENGKMSETSKKVYMNNLCRLAGTKEFKSLDFLKNTETIIKRIDGMNPNTGRSYYIAIVSAIRGRKGFKKQETIYFNKQQEMNKTLGNSSHKSDRTKEKYDGLTWDDILKRRKDLIDEYNKSRDYDTLYSLVLVSLYTLLPPRRLMDYMLMKIGTGTDHKFNYYDGTRFIFNHYKTSRTSQTQIEKVPDALVKLLALYMKHKKFPESDFLLHTSRSPSITQNNQMTTLLHKAFNNKNIGASVLRSLFLTSKYGEMMKDLRSDVKAMGTSEGVASGTYIQE